MKQKSPAVKRGFNEGEWEIKISLWSYDPRAYFLDVLTGSCYRPSLLRYLDSNQGHTD